MTIPALQMVSESLGLPDPGQAPVKRAIIRKDNRKLNVLDWGGEGQTAIFLHGGMLCAHTWDLVCSLLRNNYRCLAIDLRGHGDSDWAESYKIADHIEDILTLIETLEIETPHFVGMSLGGIIAAHTTVTGKYTPASLTLVDIAPDFSFADTSRITSFAQSDAVKGGVPALMELARSVGAKGSDAQLAYRYNTLIKPADNENWQWKYDKKKAIDFPEILSHLAQLNDIAPKITWPCMVVRGGVSKILPAETAAAFAAKCEKGSWKEVPEAGHSVQEDNPAGLAKVLKEHWETI